MIEARYIVYMLLTARGSFYVGTTTDIGRRLRQHNGELRGGAKCLRGQRPCTLVWYTTPMTRSEALKYERQLKKNTHAQKFELARS